MSIWLILFRHLTFMMTMMIFMVVGLSILLNVYDDDYGYDDDDDDGDAMTIVMMMMMMMVMVAGLRDRAY